MIFKYIEKVSGTFAKPLMVRILLKKVIFLNTRPLSRKISTNNKKWMCWLNYLKIRLLMSWRHY